MSELKEAFIQNIRLHEKLLFKICCCYTMAASDREDLYQDIVLQCWKTFPQFEGKSSFSTWLYRIALNTAISFKRKEQRRIPLSTLELSGLEDLRAESAADQEQVLLLYRMISALPELERALLLLYLEDRPHAEIADIMGITVSNVATRLGTYTESFKGTGTENYHRLKPKIWNSNK